MGLRQSLDRGLANGRELIPTVCCTIPHVVITDTLIQTSDLMVRCIMSVNLYLTDMGLGSVLFCCVSTLHFETEAIQYRLLFQPVAKEPPSKLNYVSFRPLRLG